MLDRPPIVLPANVVPVGTIACPRNCSPGGFEPFALAPGTTVAATAIAAAAKAANRRETPFMAPSISRSFETDGRETLTRRRRIELVRRHWRLGSRMLADTLPQTEAPTNAPRSPRS